MLHAASSTVVWRHWGGDPSSLIGVGILTLAYAAGVRRAWRHAGRDRGMRSWQVAAGAGGMAVLALALLSPIDVLAESLFAAHMTQHVLLAVVAPPLLVAGHVDVAVLWLFTPARRRRLTAAVRRRRMLVVAWHFLTRPLPAFAIHGIALWAWHAPWLYQRALQQPLVHVLEHASFVGTACMLWWSILRPQQSRRAAYAVGIFALFLTALHSSALGALLTISQQPWYPAQHATGLFGLSAIEDQQLAGLIMWVPAGFLYFGSAAALFALWMREMGRQPDLVHASAAGTQRR
ncbi:MAG TPA: cytochrome c oxidase assembly protein [Gemmatimonadaceae bacterium]|nr:cytochrome c oxidase assembly protein [Gemmatimonadaceae bacterium]